MTEALHRLTTRPNRTFEFKFARFVRAAESVGWADNGEFDFARIAAEIAMSERQVHRVLTLQARPSTTFAAEVLEATDEGFRRIFRIVNANEPIGRE